MNQSTEWVDKYRGLLGPFFFGGGQQIVNLLIVDLKEGNLHIDLYLKSIIRNYIYITYLPIFSRVVGDYDQPRGIDVGYTTIFRIILNFLKDFEENVTFI